MNGERDHEVNSVEERVSLTLGSLGQGEDSPVNGRHASLGRSGVVRYGSDGFVVDSHKSTIILDTPMSILCDKRASAGTAVNGSHGGKASIEVSEDVNPRRRRFGFTCQAARDKVNIYETEELLRHEAYRYYTAGGVSLVVHPESGVHDGTWKPSHIDADNIDFLTSRAVCVCGCLLKGSQEQITYLRLFSYSLIFVSILKGTDR